MIDRGEKLLWSGRPKPLALAFANGATALFGVPFLAFAIFWITQAARAPGVFWMFGIPFVVIGCGLVLSPVWHLFRAGRTTYVLTDKRAIIDTAPPFGRRRSIPLAEIRFVELQRTVGDAANVLFFETLVQQRYGRGAKKDGFVGITEPERVERMLRAGIDDTARSVSHAL